MNCQHSSRDHFKYNANRNLELIYGLCDYSLSRNIFVRCDKETIFDLPDKTISTIGLEIIDHMKFSYYDYDILSLRLGVRNIRELIIEYAAENSRIEVNKYNTNSGLNVVKLASKVRLD
ncbi:hypothetical protein HPULCUR_002151 [Helicostylum pulchrum]|uniref:Uncharacterized protein n=1 Tax=Helicostylum pulchrum TaxID=562976 RepID=A0ABP9XPP9_9FUNG